MRLGLVAEMDVVKALCEQLDLVFVPEEAYPEEPVTRRVAAAALFCSVSQVVPIAADERSITYGCGQTAGPVCRQGIGARHRPPD